MKIVREIITMAAIASVMMLILALVFYDYLIDPNQVPDKSNYIRSEEVSKVIEAKKDLEKKEEEAVIGTLSKAAYNIDSSDISGYIAEGMLKQGKVNPFEEYKESEATTTTSSTSSSSSTSANSSSSSSSSSKSSSSTTTNSDSQGTFFEKPGTK